MVLRRMMGPSLETDAVFDAALSGNYRAIAIVCLRLPSHLFVMKTGRRPSKPRADAPKALLRSSQLWSTRQRAHNVHGSGIPP